MLRVSFLLFALFLISSQNVFAEKKSFKEYWQETGLTFKDYEKFITNENCYSEANTFMGCVQSLTTVLSYFENNLYIIPTTYLTDYPEAGIVTETFGPLSIIQLVENKNIPENFFEQLTFFKKKQTTFLLNLSNAFSSIDRVDFLKLLERVKQKLSLNPTMEAHFTSDAINIYLSAVFDPHTAIRPTQQVMDSMNTPTESFAGIGAILTKGNGKVIVRNLIEGSPAHAAGIHANDIVSAVYGVEIKADEDLIETTRKVKGEAGTIVVLTIQRGEITFTVPVIRAIIKQENVSSKMLANNNGYIKFSSFMDHQGCSSIMNAIMALRKNGAKKLILDLRGNLGGLLPQAVCIGTIFLPRGKIIVSVKPMDKKTKDYQFISGSPAHIEDPLVLLTDAHSASASEVLAGAIQDNARGLIVGERTYGKGSVQHTKPMQTNPKILQLSTVARFYLPSGRTNQVVGVHPDIEVFPKPNPTEEEKYRVREEDEYTNALPPVGPDWKQPRPEYIQTVQECVTKTGHATELFEKAKSDAILPDYQLLVAQDVLNCI